MENVMDFNINQKFDIETGKKKQEVFLRLYVNSVKKGLVAKLGPTKFATLVVIASYMDADGYCYPTQRQVAEALGVSLTTASKYVNELVEFEVNGQPILKREFASGKLGKRSIYRVMPISQLAIFDSEVQPLENAKVIQKKQETTGLEKGLNSKDIISMFCGMYHEKYGVSYTPNFGRDGAMIKKKLIGTYTDEQIKKMFEVIFENYGNKWANDRFPRPSIGAVCTFLCNEAMAIIGKEQEKKQEIEKKIEESADYQTQMDSLLNNTNLFA